MLDSDVKFSPDNANVLKTWHFMYVIHVKSVKKIASAVHHRIWKHVKQNNAEYFVFSKHKWVPPITL